MCITTAFAPVSAPDPAAATEPMSSSNSSCSSCQSTVFEQAATMNNQGVVALVDHNEEAAIKVLTASLRLMKSELSKPNMDLSEYHKRRETSICLSLDLPAEMVELSTQPSTRQQSFIFHDPYENEALFTNAIIIPLSSFSGGMETSDFDIHIYSAVVVFNLALAHHQMALKHNQACRKRTINTQRGTACLHTTNRSKAEKLYNVILKLLQDAACYQVRIGVMVKLAAIHNLHWIQYQKREEQEFWPLQSQGEQEETPSLQHALSQFMRGVRQCNLSLVQRLLENDTQIQRLLMNVLWLKDQQAPPKIASAA